MSNELITFETYKPSPKQLEAHLSPTRYKLFGGAMNCGKSFWLCAEVIRLSLMFPGNQGLLARYRYKDLRRSTLPILLQMIPNKIIKSYNKTEGEIILVNKSVIYVSDLEDPNKLKSMNLGFFAIDEATDIPDASAFEMLTTRLRLQLPNIKYFGLLATNPEPGWVKDKFIDNPKSNSKFFAALPKDNPAYSEDYIREVTASLPPALVERYLHGSWEAFDDQIFQPQWIKPWDGITSKDIYKIAFIDPAVSEKQTADDTAIVTVIYDHYHDVYQDVEVIKGKWSFDLIKENARLSFRRQNQAIIWIETVQAQEWLKTDLAKDLPVTGFKPDRDKIRKAYFIQDMFESGKVRVNDPFLRKQLLEFPNGLHDDVADAFISALFVLKKMGLKPRKDDGKKFEVKTWNDNPLNPRKKTQNTNKTFSQLING